MLRGVTHRQPFGFNRDLFIRGPGVTDELSFEEYRAQFYSIQNSPPPFQTPKRGTSEDNAMDCESSEMDLEKSVPLIHDPVRRKLDFGAITPLAKEMRALSLTEKDLSDELTVNTRGVLNEMSDIFGR